MGWRSEETVASGDYPHLHGDIPNQGGNFPQVSLQKKDNKNWQNKQTSISYWNKQISATYKLKF